MSKPYFRQVPNFEYVNRNADRKSLSDYVTVKNLFRRAKLREDIFNDLSYFTKYNIIGDDRPDNIAYELYNDPTLDWLILLANNIVNVQSEWPMTQDAFFKYIDSKYGSLDKAYETSHYETIEVKNSLGEVVLPAGLTVDRNYQFYYYDRGLKIDAIASNITAPVTYYDLEYKKEDNKRNIFVLKSKYLSVVFNDLESIMPYKKGSDQYVNETLKTADNIRLYN